MCITYLSSDLSSSHRADQCVHPLQGSAQPPQRAHLPLLTTAPPRRHSRSLHPENGFMQLQARRL